VSVKETSVCVVDDAGRVILEQKVATEPADLIALLTSFGVIYGRIGIEAGPLSQWLVSALIAAELPVICVETRHIPGATGTGVFAVATVNLGIDATISAAANTGTANLPVTLTVCQTNPQSGACLAAPACSVATDIQPNATPIFGIFVTGSAAVANSPGVNRVFVTFTDAGGVLRGETSVAVRTQ
jgi:hypothetical protein